jgi:hypothetical protein
MKTCQHQGCKKERPVFNHRGEIKGKYCRDHKAPEMINVNIRRCIDCDVIPTFNYMGKTKAIYCVIHKVHGMIDVKTKICEHLGCKIRSSFNIRGQKTGKYCDTHKLHGMINVTHKTCQYMGCETRSSYNIRGEITGKYCKNHKSIEMVDVTNKKCCHNPCQTRPYFNHRGETKGILCNNHKLEGMINVVDKTCGHLGCESQPAFNYIGKIKGVYCSIHKLSGMINLKKKTSCKHIACNIKGPCFNYRGETKGIFCSKHKSNGMIDVLHKKCVLCNTGCLYGYPGIKPSHCYTHRQKGMIKRSKSKCIIPKCKAIAIYGSNWVATHCEDHRLPEEDNLVERECKSCNLLMVLDINDHCEFCNPKSFERSRLAKQNGLMDYLNSQGLEGDSTDTTVDNGVCGKERPDRVYDFGDKVVILECDENQHKERNCDCEQIRMVNISQTFGGIPVFFIRWNPDNYKTSGNNKNLEEIKKRYNMCGDLIKGMKMGRIDLPKCSLLSVIYLYFDGWRDLKSEQWKKIL